MTRSVTFWNLIANRYARQPVADEAAYQHKLAMTRAELHPDMTVLEFGCGTGSTALIHAQQVARIDAIDYSRKMIGIAQAKAAAAKVENVQFEVATIEEWPADPATYDAVLAMSILHLVQDSGAILAKVRNLLKPGGLFVSSTICPGDMGGILRHLLPLVSALPALPHISMLRAAGLVDEITRAGFEVRHSSQPGTDKALFVIARAV
jgi:2-polyprenyl-3-methyl-5-hydroxy-6-metoxy-1,4-benzoquinol methylase